MKNPVVIRAQPKDPSHVGGDAVPLSAQRVLRRFASSGCLGIRVSAGAQTTVATIDPGMTRDQVVAKLGEPLSSRSFQAYTYLLYKNGCEKTCGMNDLVVLDSGKVIDAVFRSPARKYSGTSSSPRAIPAAEVRKTSVHRKPHDTPHPKRRKAFP